MTVLDDPNWYVEVQRRVAADADHDDYTGWQFVTGAAPGFAAEDPLADRLRDVAVHRGFLCDP